MDIKILSGVSGGAVCAVASKSYAHRIIICAALADKPTRIVCNTSSQDIEATLGCVQALGASVERTDDGFIIEPIKRGANLSDVTLDCGESGSTLRFMLPLVCALGATGRLKLHGRLPQRPLSPLDTLLSENGCELDGIGSDTVSFSGKLKAGEYRLGANVSSQYITGMLLAMSCLEEDSTLYLEGEVVSEGYIDITLDVLCAFGIEAEELEGGFKILGKQRIKSPEVMKVEGDWSNSAAWLCCGALTKKGISVKGLDTESSQGDRAVASVLAYLGGAVKYKGDKVSVARGGRFGFEIDAESIPDLVPVLCAVASVCEGESKIHGISRLRAKESDRVAAICDILTRLGADIASDEETITVNGVGRLSGGEVDSYGDHRIVMAAAVASCMCDGEIIIRRAEAIAKSYPHFFEDFASLGGKYEIIN